MKGSMWQVTELKGSNENIEKKIKVWRKKKKSWCKGCKMFNKKKGDEILKGLVVVIVIGVGSVV